MTTPTEVPSGHMDSFIIMPLTDAVKLSMIGVGIVYATAGQDYIHQTIDLQGDGKIRDTLATVPAKMAYVRMLGEKG